VDRKRGCRVDLRRYGRSLDGEAVACDDKAMPSFDHIGCRRLAARGRGEADLDLAAPAGDGRSDGGGASQGAGCDPIDQICDHLIADGGATRVLITLISAEDGRVARRFFVGCVRRPG
jgi:hypothetical protein